MSGIYLELLSFLMTYRVTPKKILRVVEEAGEYPKNNLEYIAPETVYGNMWARCWDMRVLPRKRAHRWSFTRNMLACSRAR